MSLSYGSPCCPPTGLGQVEGYNRASQTRGWCSSGIKIISSPKKCSNNSPFPKSAASATASSGMSRPSIRATFNGVPRLHSSAVQFLMSRVKFGNECPPCTSPLTSLEDEIAHSLLLVRSDRKMLVFYSLEKRSPDSSYSSGHKRALSENLGKRAFYAVS